RERDLRADAGDGEQELEQLALLGVCEPVELECVLPYDEVRLDRQLLRPLGEPQRCGRRRDEVADAADVEHEPVGAPRDGLPAEARDHPDTVRSSGGASTWQMATASASAAWSGRGSRSRPRIVFTIRCTCSFSARP